MEVFFNVGKAGTDLSAMAEALGRLASLALRKGATMGGVANQLEGVGGAGNFNKAIPHAIAEALTKANAFIEPADVEITTSSPEGEYKFKAKLQEFTPAPEKKASADICPECHNASLMREEGCSKCALCGFSAC